MSVRPPPSLETRLANLAQQLPYSDEAEKGLLSCLLQEPGVRIAECQGIFGADGFYHHANRHIFTALAEMALSGAAIDPATLSHWMRERGTLEASGGPGAISEIFTFVPIPTHYDYFRAIVRQKWLVRRGLAACAENMEALFSHGKEQPDADATTVLSECEARMFEVVAAAQSGGPMAGPQPIGAYMPDWVDHLERNRANVGKPPTGITLGLFDLDRTFHGLDDAEGELCIIAARPGMGKTALAGTVIDHLALDRRIPGAFFSIEMGANQILDRLVLGHAGIDTSKGNSGMTSRHDDLVLPASITAWLQAGVHCDFSSNLTTAELRARCQVLKRQHGIRWIVIDHLDHLDGTTDAARDDERLRIVEAMKTCHWLRRELKLVVFLLVQLNEASEKNPGRLPVLSDLHGSGHIGRLATQVIFIQRPAYYKPWHKLSEEQQQRWTDKRAYYAAACPENWSATTDYADEEGGLAREDYESHALAIVRKNRRGPTPDNICLWFRKELTRFTNRTAELNSNNAARRQVLMPHA